MGGSARQLEDVRTLLKIAGPTLDHAYVSCWIEALGLTSVWDAVAGDSVAENEIRAERPNLGRCNRCRRLRLQPRTHALSRSRGSVLMTAGGGSTATATTNPARHIVIRDDRPDSLYRALGARFPAVAKIGRRGDGVLASSAVGC
ncbi:MAG: hypothetical protein U0163_07835 [Gemmatimonadaceae bacterium]